MKQKTIQEQINRRHSEFSSANNINARHLALITGMNRLNSRYYPDYIKACGLYYAQLN